MVPLVLVLVAMLGVGAVRWRLADTPLERDEGEYAYAGQLILRGVPPYRLAYNMKFPGTYYAYALSLAAFGETPRGIRAGLIVVNALTILLVFGIGRRLAGAWFGAIAAITFAVLSMDASVLGIFAHATHYVLLPAMAGFCLLLGGPRSRPARGGLAAGLLLGAAVIAKQHAALFLPLGALLVVWRGREQCQTPRNIALEVGALTAGAVLPFALLCAVLWRQGALASFWYWTVGYARAYVSEVPWAGFLPALTLGLRDATAVTWPIWLVAAAGLPMLWARRWTSAARVFILGLLAAAFLAVCPGFYFRQHYFILMLPAVALFAAVAIVSTHDFVARFLPVGVAKALAAVALGVLVAIPLVRERALIFQASPREVSRACYGSNPFIESQQVARYIRARTTAADRIAVLGSEPEIYFYAARRAATGHIYMYPLTERQPYAARMRAEMESQIESARPTYIVFVHVRTSWMSGPGSTDDVSAWIARYVQRRYQVVGAADIVSPGDTRYTWGRDAERYTPKSEDYVYVLRRRTDGQG